MERHDAPLVELHLVVTSQREGYVLQVSVVHVKGDCVVTEGGATILVLCRLPVVPVTRVGGDPCSVEVYLEAVVVIVVVTHNPFRWTALECHECRLGIEAVTQKSVANIHKRP